MNQRERTIEKISEKSGIQNWELGSKQQSVEKPSWARLN